MKLNTKRTILVGLAFMAISAFWQLYDNVVPLLLKYDFGLEESVSGYIMAADNVLALFMLPFFGALSDKVNTRYGKRTPFVFWGCIGAVIAFVVLTLVDNWQLAQVVVSRLSKATESWVTVIQDGYKRVPFSVKREIK